MGDVKVSGTIAAATRGDYPQVLVDGSWYDWASVKTVYAENGGNDTMMRSLYSGRRRNAEPPDTHGRDR